MTISITSSGISLDGPLVAGEKVAVSVSGLALAAEDKPTLALLARFPDALLASVELAEDADTPGTWTGELDTATKQTALFFATARADERRDAALELVAGRVSLARLTVPMANSALCPKPDGSPFASPVYVPVPGPPGTGGDPYDQTPEMDGEASAGTVDEYARGNHRHPTDTTRQAVIEDLAAIRSGAAAGATAVQPAALSAYRTASAQDAIDGAQNTAIAAKYTKPATGIPAGDLASAVQTALTNARTPTAHASTAQTFGVGDETQFGHIKLSDDPSASTLNVDQGTAATPYAVSVVWTLASETASAVAALATVATTGDYDDLTNKPTIPDVSGKADSASLAPAFSTSSTYAVGDYVTHEGLLYKCTTAVTTAGAWNAANWTAVSAMAEMPAAQVNADWNAVSGVAAILNKPTIPSAKPTHIYNATGMDALDDKGQLFKSSVQENYWVTGSGTHSDILDYEGYNSDNQFYHWKSRVTDFYGKPFYIRYYPATGTVIQRTYNNDYGTWNSYTLGVISENLNPASGDSLPDLPYTFHDGNTGAVFHPRVIAVESSPYAHFALESLPDRTWAAGTWNVGDLVKYDGKAYRCIAAATSSNTSAPSSDTTHWAEIALLSDKAPLASPAFTGTPTAPTAAAGTNTTQVATTAFVQTEARYALTAKTPTVSGTSATVACEDRAINDFTVATGITSLTITPPAAVTGRARDFFCRVTLTDSSLPTVTLSGATIDIGATEVAGMTQGVNLLMFTEIASGHWLASRRSAS